MLNSISRLRQRRGRLLVLSAPSGSGKTTLVKRLLRRRLGLAASVSWTTRPPRDGERDGRDYHFVTPAAFARQRRRGGFLEWARVHGSWYGTPKGTVMRALRGGRDVLLNIDVQGARQIRRRCHDSVGIFVLPPSWRALQARLKARRTESRRERARRLAEARRELACAAQYDYVVVNARLEEAVRQLIAIIQAERLRIQKRS